MGRLADGPFLHLDRRKPTSGFTAWLRSAWIGSPSAPERPLGGVEGCVGADEQFFGVVRIWIGGNGDAACGGDREHMLPPEHWCA